MLKHKLWASFFSVCRKVCMALGGIALVMLVLAFTRIPFDAHRWLGTAGGLCQENPDAIVVLGGSGMPSGPELMRCNLAADLARNYTSVQVVLLLPKDTALAAAMEQELHIKGIARERISAVLHGRNTREQALDLWTNNPGLAQRNIALVTAPENMYRSLLTFRKAGFTNVCGSPAFDHALFDDLSYAHGRIGGKAYVPDVSNNMDLRYDLWNRLKLEITCLREYAAIAYYKLNGWI
jgi:uncharacterized SAM-binding protein YcdF (DUF218 family)